MDVNLCGNLESFSWRVWHGGEDAGAVDTRKKRLTSSVPVRYPRGIYVMVPREAVQDRSKGSPALLVLRALRSPLSANSSLLQVKDSLNLCQFRGMQLFLLINHFPLRFRHQL